MKQPKPFVRDMTARPIKGSRKLIIDEDTYWWFYVSTNNIVIWAPDGQKFFPNRFEVLGGDINDKDSYEKYLVYDSNESTPELPITPGNVSRYIRDSILAD